MKKVYKAEFIISDTVDSDEEQEYETLTKTWQLATKFIQVSIEKWISHPLFQRDPGQLYAIKEAMQEIRESPASSRFEQYQILMDMLNNALNRRYEHEVFIQEVPVITAVSELE